MRIALVDAQNNVVNVAEWAGVTAEEKAWAVAMTAQGLQQIESADAERGGTYDPKTKLFSPAVVEAPVPTEVELKLQDLDQQLQNLSDSVDTIATATGVDLPAPADPAIPAAPVGPTPKLG